MGKAKYPSSLKENDTKVFELKIIRRKKIQALKQVKKHLMVKSERRGMEI